MRAETIRPTLKQSIRVPSSHHPPELVCYVVVLGLERACLGKLLSVSARAVAAPFAEDNVTDHHLVVRRINVRECSWLKFGGLIDLRIAVFINYSECWISLFPDANFRPLYRLFAAGFSVFDPFTADEVLTPAMWAATFWYCCLPVSLRFLAGGSSGLAGPSGGGASGGLWSM